MPHHRDSLDSPSVTVLRGDTDSVGQPSSVTDLSSLTEGDVSRSSLGSCHSPARSNTTTPSKQSRHTPHTFTHSLNIKPDPDDSDPTPRAVTPQPGREEEQSGAGWMHVKIKSEPSTPDRPGSRSSCSGWTDITAFSTPEKEGNKMTFPSPPITPDTAQARGTVGTLRYEFGQPSSGGLKLDLASGRGLRLQGGKFDRREEEPVSGEAELQSAVASILSESRPSDVVYMTSGEQSGQVLLAGPTPPVSTGAGLVRKVSPMVTAGSNPRLILLPSRLPQGEKSAVGPRLPGNVVVGGGGRVLRQTVPTPVLVKDEKGGLQLLQPVQGKVTTSGLTRLPCKAVAGRGEGRSLIRSLPASPASTPTGSRSNTPKGSRSTTPVGDSIIVSSAGDVSQLGVSPVRTVLVPKDAVIQSGDRVTGTHPPPSQLLVLASNPAPPGQPCPPRAKTPQQLLQVVPGNLAPVATEMSVRPTGSPQLILSCAGRGRADRSPILLLGSPGNAVGLVATPTTKAGVGRGQKDTGRGGGGVSLLRPGLLPTPKPNQGVASPGSSKRGSVTVQSASPAPTVDVPVISLQSGTQPMGQVGEQPSHQKLHVAPVTTVTSVTTVASTSTVAPVTAVTPVPTLTSSQTVKTATSLLNLSGSQKTGASPSPGKPSYVPLFLTTKIGEQTVVLKLDPTPPSGEGRGTESKKATPRPPDNATGRKVAMETVGGEIRHGSVLGLHNRSQRQVSRQTPVPIVIRSVHTQGSSTIG